MKSTAQQEEEKRKEREKKLKIYVAARDACFSKVPPHVGPTQRRAVALKSSDTSFRILVLFHSHTHADDVIHLQRRFKSPVEKNASNGEIKKYL